MKKEKTTLEEIVELARANERQAILNRTLRYLIKHPRLNPTLTYEELEEIVLAANKKGRHRNK